MEPSKQNSSTPNSSPVSRSAAGPSAAGPSAATTVSLDFLGDLRRTHSCGELRASDVGNRAVLMGWVHRRRDLGGLIFIHLRDRSGITQVVFNSENQPAAHERAQQLRGEFVVAVEGPVVRRSENPTVSCSYRARACGAKPS